MLLHNKDPKNPKKKGPKTKPRPTKGATALHPFLICEGAALISLDSPFHKDETATGNVLTWRTALHLTSLKEEMERKTW